MKRCPSCHRVYPDSAPNFCGTDGAPLVTDAPPQQSQQSGFRLNQVKEWQTPFSSLDSWQQDASFSSPAAQSPPQIDRNPMRNWVRNAWITTAVSLVAGVGALLAGLTTSQQEWRGGTPVTIISVIVGAFALAGIIAAPIIALTTGRHVKKIDAMLAGKNLLAQWRYAPDEWARHLEREFARVRGVIWASFLWIPLGLTIFLGLIGIFASKGDVFVTAMIALAGGGVGLFIGTLIWAVAYHSVARLRDKGTGGAYIASHGVLFGGRYYGWEMSGMKLLSVKRVRDGADDVVFEYRQHTGKSTVVNNLHIPVPRGRDAEAQGVIAFFNSGG